MYTGFVLVSGKLRALLLYLGMCVRLRLERTACQSLKIDESICLVGFRPIRSWAHQGFTLVVQMCQVAAAEQSCCSCCHSAMAMQNRTHSPAAVEQPQATW